MFIIQLSSEYLTTICHTFGYKDIRFSFSLDDNILTIFNEDDDLQEELELQMNKDESNIMTYSDIGCFEFTFAFFACDQMKFIWNDDDENNIIISQHTKYLGTKYSKIPTKMFHKHFSHRKLIVKYEMTYSDIIHLSFIHWKIKKHLSHESFIMRHNNELNIEFLLNNQFNLKEIDDQSIINLVKDNKVIISFKDKSENVTPYEIVLDTLMIDILISHAKKHKDNITFRIYNDKIILTIAKKTQITFPYLSESFQCKTGFYEIQFANPLTIIPVIHDISNAN